MRVAIRGEGTQRPSVRHPDLGHIGGKALVIKVMLLVHGRAVHVGRVDELLLVGQVHL